MIHKGKMKTLIRFIIICQIWIDMECTFSTINVLHGHKISYHINHRLVN